MSMKRFAVSALVVCAIVAGLGALSGCGKKEMPTEPTVGPATSTGEALPKEEPVLIGETAHCKVYRMSDRTNGNWLRYVYLTECGTISAGIAVP